MAEIDPDFWPKALTKVVAHEALSRDEAAEAMRQVMAGEASTGQLGGLLMALRTKGETVDEVEGFARTMLEFAQPVGTRGPLVDTCGTGGDRRGTFNISTVAAIVAAGAGVRVAKHGNRAASSHCGSADVLEALGVRIDLEPPAVARCLEDVGIAFMFARVFHPAMAHAGPVRSELRVPTIFNFLGPLTNPARPTAQVVGVSDPHMLPLMAEVLARRGTRAMLVRGEDGIDELTTTGGSVVYDVVDDTVSETSIDPVRLGLPLASIDDLAGGDAETSAEIARAILAGEAGPRRDVVLLNAAAALTVAGRATSIEHGLELAARSIDDGAAANTLERWIVASTAEPSEPR